MATDTEAVVVRMRGAGGVVWDMDLPAAGTTQRELFDEKIAKGELAFEDGIDPREDASADESENPGTEDEIPHKVDDVIDWVRGAPEGEDSADGWPERAQRALDAEIAKDEKARSTLVEKLEDIIASADEPENPGT